MTTNIRPVDRSDLGYLIALNGAAVPAVNHLGQADLERLLAMSPYCRVAEQDGAPAGFMLGFEAGADYESINYRWFSARYDRFAYVDRIVIDANNRGRGLGSALYDDFERWARARDTPWLGCEVNLRPPNEPSLAFHRSRGFIHAGEQDTEGGAKTVTLLLKAL